MDEDMLGKAMEGVEVVVSFLVRGVARLTGPWGSCPDFTRALRLLPMVSRYLAP